MAQYRYSAQVISRSSGRSVTAAAAYRAAEAIPDDRTGIIHDYSRKSGVVHTEIMAPDNTPEWMLNRTLLWNAVEAAEKRKDAQLAREVQLSLPFNIPPVERVKLVQEFVREQFVAKGMIADFAIHHPDRDTDDRNHHAHILLTMRSLTSEGFGPKPRSTMDEKKKELMAERETWAHHQNRTFERLGMAERVDHRSFSDRLIDRKPTVHMGPTASDMEKKGEPSRIGDQNREIVAENSRRAETVRLQAEAETIRKVIAFPRPPARPVRPVFNLNADNTPKTRKEQLWAQRDHERRVALERRQFYATLDLERKQEPQKHALAADQVKRNEVLRATMSAEIDAIDRRLQAKGVTRFFRNMLGFTRTDTESRKLHQKTLDGMDRRDAEERAGLEERHREEKLRIFDKYRLIRAHLEVVIATQVERRKQLLGRSMVDEKDRKPPQGGERLPPPPKLEPSPKPAPPQGAGRVMTPRDHAVYDRKVQEWASSPEGKKELARDAAPKLMREDWRTSSPPVPDPKPDPVKEPAKGPVRAKEDWWEVAPPAPEKQAPSPAPEASKVHEAKPVRAKSDWWDVAPPDAKPEKEPGNEKGRDRERD